MNPLKVKASGSPITSANISGLQTMTNAEVQNYIANVITEKFAALTDGTGTAEINITTDNSGSGTSIGTFTDTNRTEAIGTHPASGTTTSTTYYAKQVTAAASESITNRPLAWDSHLEEMTDSDIDGVLDLCIASMAAESAYTAGQYRLQATAPSGGTWVSRYTITDTALGGNTVTYLWQKTVSSSSPNSDYTPLRIYNGRNCKQMTEAEIEQMLPNFRNRIIDSGIGTYKLQETAPGSGTWVQMGNTFSDTREQISPQNYAGNYVGNFSGNFTGNYSQAYSNTFSTSTNYTSNFSGNYAGTAAYSSSFSATGNYSGPSYSVGPVPGPGYASPTLVYLAYYTGFFTQSPTPAPGFAQNYTGFYSGSRTYSGNYAGLVPGGSYTGYYSGSRNYSGNYVGYYTGNYVGPGPTYSSTFSGAPGPSYSTAFTAQPYVGYYAGAPTGYAGPGYIAFIPNFPEPTTAYYSTFYSGPGPNYSGAYTSTYIIGTPWGPLPAPSTFIGSFSAPGGTYTGYFAGTTNYSGSYAGFYAGSRNYAGTYAGPSYSGSVPAFYSGSRNYAGTYAGPAYLSPYYSGPPINYPSYSGNFAGAYTGFFTGLVPSPSYTGFFSGPGGSYTGYFTGPANYSGNYTGSFSTATNYTGYFTANYSGSYLNTFSGTFSGNYSGATVQATKDTVSSVKLWIRTA